MQAAEPTRRRPLPITIICILGGVGAIAAALVLFSGEAAKIAPWYPALLGSSVIIGVVCFVGLWMMRRWAVYVYAGFALVMQGIMLATGIWSPAAFILPAIVIAVMFAYLSRMH